MAFARNIVIRKRDSQTYKRRKKRLLKLADGRPCRYCKRAVQTFNKDRDDFATVDHKNPLVLGGGHNPDNLVLACIRCNREKDDMTEKVYLEWVAAGRPDRRAKECR